MKFFINEHCMIRHFCQPGKIILSATGFVLDKIIANVINYLIFKFRSLPSTTSTFV